MNQETANTLALVLRTNNVCNDLSKIIFGLVRSIEKFTKKYEWEKYYRLSSFLSGNQEYKQYLSYTIRKQMMPMYKSIDMNFALGIRYDNKYEEAVSTTEYGPYVGLVELTEARPYRAEDSHIYDDDDDESSDDEDSYHYNPIPDDFGRNHFDYGVKDLEPVERPDDTDSESDQQHDVCDYDFEIDDYEYENYDFEIDY